MRKKIKDLMSNMDIFPTIFDILGIKNIKKILISKIGLRNIGSIYQLNMVF